MEKITNLNKFRDNQKETNEKIIEILFKMLSVGDINGAMKMKEAQDISDDIINSPEVQGIARRALLHTLPKGRDFIYDAFSFKKIFNIPEEDVQEIIEKVIKNEETRGMSDNIILIKKVFEISDKSGDIHNVA